MKKNKNKIQNTTSHSGLMTISKLENGLNALDFMCTEDVEVEPFTANCKVQAMHNGDIYITELPKRIHNKPLFREDNSTLTLGRDRRYYFVFTLPEEQVEDLPLLLVPQAAAIAQKVAERILGRKEAKR